MAEGIYRAASLLERRWLSHTHWSPKHPPLFILGPPRSGTTFVSLLLFNAFRWAYFPNAAKEHPNACLTATALARLRHRYTITYSNLEGHVDGQMAPSDGWDIWHRWFPRYQLDEPVRAEQLSELATIVRCLEKMFGAPFTVKNNNNSTRIAALRATFPEAIFLSVSRDPIATVRSNLQVRRRHGVALNEWWSAAPPQFWNERFSDEVDQVAHQVIGLDAHIRSSLADAGPDRHVKVRYEDACSKPAALVKEVADLYAARGIILHPRPAHHAPTVSASLTSPHADADISAAVGRARRRVT